MTPDQLDQLGESVLLLVLGPAAIGALVGLLVYWLRDRAKSK